MASLFKLSMYFVSVKECTYVKDQVIQQKTKNSHLAHLLRNIAYVKLFDLNLNGNPIIKTEVIEQEPSAQWMEGWTEGQPGNVHPL